MLKPVEPVGVSDYQCPPHDGRQSLEELVAVPAHPQVLVHPDRLPVPAVHAVAQQPQADGEPLTVLPQALRAGLLVDVVQRELRVAGAVPELLPHPRLHVPQDAADVTGLRVRLLVAVENPLAAMAA